jgi:CDP-glucose 4,6-dehydratase
MDVIDGEFWRDRRVLVTGHTGFKGAWLALWLNRLGARVTGLALPPEHSCGMFQAAGPWPGLDMAPVDLRDAAAVGKRVADADPDVVFHLGAQALVRRGYADPTGTFTTNVGGTVNLLSACASAPRLAAVLVVTSDKVYSNDDRGRAFRESDPLGGADPYSCSKASAELAVTAWRSMSRTGDRPAFATARAGNVIGGGDWAADRVVPDVFRALASSQPVRLRYPEAVRPWQHVLEPLSGYLLMAQQLSLAPATVPTSLNFGPARDACCSTGALVDAVLAEYGSGEWVEDELAHPREHVALLLDSTRAREHLGWCPRLELIDAVRWTVAWRRAQLDGDDMRAFSLRQLGAYEERVEQ